MILSAMKIIGILLAQSKRRAEGRRSDQRLAISALYLKLAKNDTAEASFTFRVDKI